MSRNIIYLINPISGTRGKRSLKEMIRQKTEERGISFSILPTNADGDYSHLSEIIRTQGVTDIVICGGDGTVSAVAAALYRQGLGPGQNLAPYANVGPSDETRPASPGGDGTVSAVAAALYRQGLGPGQNPGVRLGVIPMGSGNGLAFAAGIPKDPARALEIVFAGRSADIDGVLINDVFSCMLCGIGLDGQVAHEFAGQPRRGLQTYIRITMRNFFRARPYRFTLCIPGGSAGDGAGDAAAGQELRVDAFFISIANGNQFGNNFTIAPKADLTDGLLDIVIAKKTNRFHFFWSVIRQVLGGYRVQSSSDGSIGGPSAAGNGKIIYFQTSALEIGNPDEAPLHVDGDPKPSARKFRVVVAPGAIRLIIP